MQNLSENQIIQFLTTQEFGRVSKVYGNMITIEVFPSYFKSEDYVPVIVDCFKKTDNHWFNVDKGIVVDYGITIEKYFDSVELNAPNIIGRKTVEIEDILNQIKKMNDLNRRFKIKKMLKL